MSQIFNDRTNTLFIILKSALKIKLKHYAKIRKIYNYFMQCPDIQRKRQTVCHRGISHFLSYDDNCLGSESFDKYKSEQRLCDISKASIQQFA